MNFLSISLSSRVLPTTLARRSFHGSSARLGIMMPALSPFMTRGNISRWIKKEGETFKPGDTLLEIETEYARVKVEAENSGTMGQILSPDGSTNVPVEQVIALVESKTTTETIFPSTRPTAQMRPPPPPLVSPSLPRQHTPFPNRGAANLDKIPIMATSGHRPNGAATVRGIAIDHAAPQRLATLTSSSRWPTNRPDHSDNIAAENSQTITAATELRKTIVSNLSRQGSAQYFDGLI
ncbi:Dihydrolipoyllysine-residue acetyltransferase [Favolaschia claudopus]|uniref:Dihydrolipoyllysine-residue acetyltransferase n=1 Tax=Favolaschia claudopus TaxID=2862362 RepID=A0AAW0C9P4_9AGAR